MDFRLSFPWERMMFTKHANPSLASHALIDRIVNEFSDSVVLVMNDDINVRRNRLRVMASRLRRHMRNLSFVSISEIVENSNIRGIRLRVKGMVQVNYIPVVSKTNVLAHPLAI